MRANSFELPYMSTSFPECTENMTELHDLEVGTSWAKKSTYVLTHRTFAVRNSFTSSELLPEVKRVHVQNPPQNTAFQTNVNSENWLW
jgi:hypothetical protein